MSCPAGPSRDATEDKGLLVNNYMTVRQLRQVLGDADHSLTIVPCLIKEVIEDGCYIRWLDPHTGERGGFPPHEFRRFIEAKRSEGGLETPLSVIRRFLGDDTPERLLFEDAIRSAKGGDYNPYGRTGKPPEETYRANVTLDNGVHESDTPVTIPLSQGKPRPREYDREAPTGNSTSYAIRQLERGRKIGGELVPPRPDLLEKVKAREMSIHKAMLEAGYRKPTISLPVDPEAATRLIVKHFRGEALEELVRGLANWAGIEIVDPASAQESEPVRSRLA